MGNQRLKNIIEEQRDYIAMIKQNIEDVIELIHNAPVPSDEAFRIIETKLSKFVSGKKTT